MRSRFRALPARAFGAVLAGALYVAASVLSPWRLGQLLRVVSIPRLRQMPLRTTLNVVGIAIGVAVLVSVMLVNRSILDSVVSTVEDVSGRADLQVTSSSAGIDEALVERARAVQGVAKAVPVIEQLAIIDDARAKGERLWLLGYDLLGEDDPYFRPDGAAQLAEIKGDPIAFLNSLDNLIVSRTLASKLGLSLHDHLSVSTAIGVRSFEVWGILDEGRIGRAFGGSVAVMYYPALQATFDRGHNVDRIEIALAPGADAAAVAQSLKAALGTAYVVEPPAGKGARVAKMYSATRLGLSIAGVVALIVGMFLIYNTVSISVIQRRRELATLRALGMRARDQLRLLLAEALVFGIVGSGLGLLLGVGLSRLLLAMTAGAVNELLLQIAAKDVHVDWPVLAAGFLVGVSAAVVAAALPAIRTAGRSIVDSLRRTGTALRPNRRRVRLSDWLGVFLIGSAYLLLRLPSSGSVLAGAFATSAALLIGSALLVPWVVRLIHAVASGLAVRVGPSALLASENLVRDLGRTSTTAAALMACVAMTGSFGAYIEGFSQSLSTWTAQRFPGDLYITNADAISGISYRNIPMTETLGRAIRKVRGVADVRALRIARLEYGAYPVKLVASDYDVLARFGSLRMLEGTQAEALDQLRAGGVVVSENFSRHFGVHAGDRITLSTHDGGHAFAVGGVAVDYTSDIGTLLVDRAAYARFWGDTRVDTYEVYVAPGESAAAVRARIRSGPAIGFDLFVLDNAGFRGEITGRLDQVFAVARLLELVAIIVAVLGVVNALLASVLDRVHEIGVVRALGGLRRQVRRSLMIEAALLATAGVLAGVLAGIALGYVVLMHVNLSQTGWYFPYSVPFRTFLETAAVVIASAALAGFLPGWAAARLLIADAVSSDG